MKRSTIQNILRAAVLMAFCIIFLLPLLAQPDSLKVIATTPPDWTTMIIPWTLLLLSEVMPYLPTKANGIVQLIFNILKAVFGQKPPSQ
jgi:hypothetical protein